MSGNEFPSHFDARETKCPNCQKSSFESADDLMQLYEEGGVKAGAVIFKCNNKNCRVSEFYGVHYHTGSEEET